MSEEVKIRTMKIHKNLFVDSDDIILNDEYIGEIPQKKYIITKDISNCHDNIYNNNNIKIIREQKSIDDNYDNNTYVLSSPSTINFINRTPHKKLEYGNVIEERRNYKLYVSGVENVNNDFNGRENNNIHMIRNNSNRINLFNHEKYLQKSPSFKSYKYCDEYTNNNINDYHINSKIVRTNRNQDLNYFSNNYRNIPSYIYYSSPIKKTYKSPYSLRSKGILKDNAYGQYYRVFQAIPIDINDCEDYDDKYNNNKMYSVKINYNDINNYHNKRHVNAYNNNFIINSNDINRVKEEQYIFVKPEIKTNKNYNSNLHTIESTPESDNNIKPIYFKKKVYKPSITMHNFYKKKANNNNNIKIKIQDNQEYKKDNNNYIRIKETNKNINNNKYIEIKETNRNKK